MADDDVDYELYGDLLDQGIDPDDDVIIYDDYGDVLAEGTFGDLYEDTFLGAEEFAEKYGDDYTTTDLIYDLEYAFDIEWDWETWRENYGGE